MPTHYLAKNLLTTGADYQSKYMTMNQLARIISALIAQGMTREEAIAHMSGRYFIKEKEED